MINYLIIIWIIVSVVYIKIIIIIIIIITIINSIMNKEKRSLKTLTEIRQAKILKQTIMTPIIYPPTFLPR